MKAKVNSKLTFKQIQRQINDFANNKPWHLAGIGAAVFIGLYLILSFLSAAEFFPEPQKQPVQRAMVFEKGDSMMWIDMELAPVSRSIRKSFKIPGNIKGIFVIDEGKSSAQQYGVKTGDVIVSIGRKPVPSAREFIKVANRVQYSDGILLDIYRDGNQLYITIPFAYQYGPLMGPNKGSWQLGSPVVGQAFRYGPIVR
ncbi:MAG: hypothetical protein HQL25_07515 [Candidatus Omnitrophica bacterium]|nr:hypothetical protein [Candidatus Omnitrophota bacterium]